MNHAQWVFDLDESVHTKTEIKPLPSSVRAAPVANLTA